MSFSNTSNTKQGSPVPVMKDCSNKTVLIDDLLWRCFNVMQAIYITNTPATTHKTGPMAVVVHCCGRAIIVSNHD